MVSDGALLVATSALAIGVALFAFTIKFPLPNQQEPKSKTKSLQREPKSKTPETLALKGNVGTSSWRNWFNTKNENEGEKGGGVKSAGGLLAAIGNTPLIRIDSLSDATGCEIFGKCEFLNPGGSVKDRVAVKIIEEGLSSGQLQPGGLVCEGSAGSTGVSLALVARAFGCRCFVALPDDAAIEKSQMLEALGAQLERVRPVAITHPGHFVNVARRRAQEASGKKDPEVEKVVRQADSNASTLKANERDQRTAQSLKSKSDCKERSELGIETRSAAQKAAISRGDVDKTSLSKKKQAKCQANRDGPKFLSDGSAKKARKARKKQLNALNEMVVTKRGPDSQAGNGAKETDTVALEWGQPWFDYMGTPGDDDDSPYGESESKEDGEKKSDLRREGGVEASKAKSALLDVANGIEGHLEATETEAGDKRDSKSDESSASSNVPDELDQRTDSSEQKNNGLAGSVPFREAGIPLANGNEHRLSALSEGNGSTASGQGSEGADCVDTAESFLYADVCNRAAHSADAVNCDKMNRELAPNSERLVEEVRSAEEKNGDLSPSRDDVRSACLSEERPSSGFFADQFENLANFRAHYEGTGPEIWAQTGGKISAFVAGAGTGGTLAGISCYLKEQDPGVRCFLVDPPGSGLYYKVTRGVLYAPQEAEGKRLRNPFDTITEGIGINRLTRNFEQAKLDGAFRATDQEAVDMARYLLLNDGLFVGSSSAVNCVGAFRAAKALGPGHVIVTILCDGGQRHLSKFHNSEYLKAHGLTPSKRGALPLT